jgi:protein-S-isoprenylcysteine O-methyltransferase Ste14
MNAYAYPVAACWLLFTVYWAITAIRAKKNLAGPGFRRGMYFRAALLVAVILIVHFTGDRHVVRHVLRNAGTAQRDDTGNGFLSNALVRSIGVALCALGVALAIWARTIIGRNWGMPMSLKENPELVTSGPYARIRHPIYTGVLIALVGTSLAIDTLLLIVFLMASAYFVYSAKKEEETMTSLFPDAYPDYRRRTNMLVPFLL